MNDKSASHICFYGTDSVEGLFNYLTMILTAPDGSEYALAVNVPNADFNETGDIENNAEFTLQQKVLTSLIGQLCTVDIYLTDELYDYQYDLSYYAVNYIDDYDTVTEIPETNAAFLNKGITAKKINAFLSSGGHFDDNYKKISSSENLLTVPKLTVDTSSCTDMSYMFYELSSATSIDTSWIDTPNVTDMSYMFSYCDSLT